MPCPKSKPESAIGETDQRAKSFDARAPAGPPGRELAEVEPATELPRRARETVHADACQWNAGRQRGRNVRVQGSRRRIAMARVERDPPVAHHA